MGLQATTVRDILLSASTYGMAYDEICAATGLHGAELACSERKVEWEKAALLWELLADLSSDEQIGLQLGRDVNVAMLGMVGFLMQSSRTLEEAIEAYCEYGFMVCPMLTLEYEQTSREAILTTHQNEMWKASYPRSARIAMDHSFSSCLQLCYALSGKHVYPLRVELSFPKAALSVYRERLQCELRFGAEANRMVFRAADVKLPILSRDQSLNAMFREILGQKKSLLVQGSTRAMLKHLLLMQFRGQLVSAEEAADALGMNVRTLQRKLAEEGTSFRAISAEVRKELALQLIRRSDNNINEVAEILGYADSTSFRRAFKGWTKSTPKAAKRELAAA